MIFQFKLSEFWSFLLTKKIETLIPKCTQNAFRGTNLSKFSWGRSSEPPPPYERGLTPSRALPLSNLRYSTISSAGPLFKTRRRPCHEKIYFSMYKQMCSLVYGDHPTVSFRYNDILLPTCKSENTSLCGFAT